MKTKKIACVVLRCKRSAETSKFCAHHWRMIPKLSRQMIERTRDASEITIARAQVEREEREDIRNDRAGL